MFSIVISEKGGAERREVFDKSEINVGRVQGNDLLLAKGNVSKRHARLLLRDGRYIVTDLKSTNGTYVNGRKIMQATIVREGDKIYVGDFVLRIETGGSVAQSPPLPMDELSSPTGPSGIPPTPLDENATSRREGFSLHSISDFEANEPASSAGARVPGPPRLPSSASTARSVGQPLSTPSSSDPSLPQFQPALPLHTLIPRVTGSPAPPREELALHMAALMKLVDRIAEMIDLAPLELGAEPDEVLAHRIERAIREQVKTLRDDAEIPETLDAETLARDAQREILGLGPLDPLLADETVEEIHVLAHDRIVLLRSEQSVWVPLAFSTARSLRRILARLCRSSGRPLSEGETVIERQLPRGVSLYALAPPLTVQGHVLVLRKQRTADLGVEDLVRSGTISRAMATFLLHVAAARANVLVVGPSSAAVASLVGALAGAASPEDRTVAGQLVDELAGLKPSPVRFQLPDTGEAGARVIRAAVRLDPDRLVVSSFAGKVAAEVASAISEGAHGVIAASRAPTLRQALDRLAPDLAAARPGLPPEAARSWLAASFDIAVEVATLRDGRHRVLRIAELFCAEPGVILAQDIFSFIVERTAAGGALEGLFCASGLVPRLADELAARGNGLDPAIFKRTGR